MIVTCHVSSCVMFMHRPRFERMWGPQLDSQVVGGGVGRTNKLLSCVMNKSSSMKHCPFKVADAFCHGRGPCTTTSVVVCHVSCHVSSAKFLSDDSPSHHVSFF